MIDHVFILSFFAVQIYDLYSLIQKVLWVSHIESSVCLPLVNLHFTMFQCGGRKRHKYFFVGCFPSQWNTKNFDQAATNKHYQQWLCTKGTYNLATDAFYHRVVHRWLPWGSSLQSGHPLAYHAAQGLDSSPQHQQDKWDARLVSAALKAEIGKETKSRMDCYHFIIFTEMS